VVAVKQRGYKLLLRQKKNSVDGVAAGSRGNLGEKGPIGRNIWCDDYFVPKYEQVASPYEEWVPRDSQAGRGGRIDFKKRTSHGKGREHSRVRQQFNETDGRKKKESCRMKTGPRERKRESIVYFMEK